VASDGWHDVHPTYASSLNRLFSTYRHSRRVRHARKVIRAGEGGNQSGGATTKFLIPAFAGMTRGIGQMLKQTCLAANKFSMTASKRSTVYG